jgi:ABC-type Fe3+-citrate transport system substrate-binding protein
MGSAYWHQHSKTLALAEHDERLAKVMSRLEASDVTLNGVKYSAFRKPSMKFIGQLISKDGVRADPCRENFCRKKHGSPTFSVRFEEISGDGEPTGQVLFPNL